jgi:hypothetical protein
MLMAQSVEVSSMGFRQGIIASVVGGFRGSVIYPHPMIHVATPEAYQARLEFRFVRDECVHSRSLRKGEKPQWRAKYRLRNRGWSPHP